MSFNESVKEILTTNLEVVLKEFAEYYDIDESDIKATLHDYTTTPQVCSHRFIRGKNKGSHCPKKPLENGYCSTHQKTILKLQAVTGLNGTVERKVVISKTRQQIIDWLNTAVPQEETVLTKTEHGLLHKDTEIIFSPNFVAIGKLNLDKVIGLTDFEVEMCEQRGWKYEVNDSGSEESS